MKKTPFFLLTFISFASFSQDCPCVKTAVIGNSREHSVMHNNKVVAMDNMTINMGELIRLYAKSYTGKIAWYIKEKVILMPLVAPTETTEYTVKSSLDGCPDAIARVLIQVDKSKTSENSNSVSVFPNPTNANVTIVSKYKAIRAIHVSNSIGNNMLQCRYKDNSRKQLLDISSLNVGFYIILIEVEGNETIIKKMIKN